MGDGFSILAGTSKPAFELAEELVKSNTEVTIITSNPSNVHGQVHNGTISRMALGDVEIIILPSLFRALLLRPNRYRSMIRKKLMECDIIHGYDYVSLPLIGGLLGTDRKRIPLVYSCTGDYKLRPKNLLKVGTSAWSNIVNPHFIFKGLCPDIVFRRLFNGFDMIVSRCDYIAQQLKEDGVDPSKIKRIPVGINTERYESVTAKSEVGGSSRYDFAYFGWGSALRGVPQLLEAFDEVKKEKRDAKLGIFFLGSHEIEERALTAVIRRRKDFKSSVSLEVGPNESMPTTIMSAKAVVLPFQSSFGYAHPPLTVLESMLLKRTVVTTTIGSMPEIISDGRNGILIEPHSVDDLARGMKRTFDDSLRMKIGENAQEDIKRIHNIRTVAGKMVEAYESIAGGV